MDTESFKSLTGLSSKTLILIRGLPGSGKSTLAQALQKAYFTDDWFEADMYFEGPDGYKFDPALLGDAHDWCQGHAAKAMECGSHVVIVSNTFTQLKEMAVYLEIADVYGYTVQIIHTDGKFQSVHNVPDASISKMKARWERFNV